MSFRDKWEYPEGHPISVKEAEVLMSGALGQQYREMLMSMCSPIYWHDRDASGRSYIVGNGTLTFASFEGRTIGLTAAHVVRGIQEAAASPNCILQIGNSVYDLDVIAIDNDLDLATLTIPPDVIAGLGKTIAPTSLSRPGEVPDEGRGILLAGFPGEDRRVGVAYEIDWGLFTATGIARRINEDQITWSPDHDRHIPTEGVPKLPRNKDLGGISGGPLVALFEKQDGLLQYHSLAAIVVEASSTLENVVARRLDVPRARALFR